MKLRRWLLPVLWAGVMLTGTSLPSSAVPEQVAGYDKFLHFTIYAIFAVLLVRPTTEVATRWQAVVLTVTIAMLFAAADEWHQGYIPGRSSELADWRADSLGAVVGAVAGSRRRSPVSSSPTA